MTKDDLPSVMKFGGSSFADAARMHSVCQWISVTRNERGPAHRVICVVSAPSGLTEQYRETLHGLNATPSDRLIDAGLPLADSIGAVMVAAALQSAGVKATIALGNQIGLRTDVNYTRARLTAVETEPIAGALEQYEVVVVPGGQASAQATGETTWMGKNSSDLSAIALAAAFGCDQVEIFSDVPGVYSCDPNVVEDAHLLWALPYRQATTMSFCGAKVLHHRGVEHAEQHGVRIVCRANHGDFAVGTVLKSDARFAAAVIPDARSRCFAGTSKERERGCAALEQAGVTCLTVEDANGEERLVVTCGFFDSRHFLQHEQGLALEELDARLLSVALVDGSLSHELVPSSQLAARTREQHARHCSTPVCQAFDRKLAVWSQTECATHV